MAFHAPRFSKGFTTCGAATCAVLVLLLQNSGSCMNWLREKLSDMALYSSTRNVSKVLQSISNVACLEVLNHAEKNLSGNISEALKMTLAEGARNKKKGANVAAVISVAQENPAPSTAKSQTPPVSQQPVSHGKISPMRYRIQMVGDSMMVDLGHMVHFAMREHKGVEFILSAKSSTGLSRPDYFNWPVQLREMVAHYKPDLVVFFFGANDSMPVLTEGGTVPMGGQRWRDAYAKKMEEMVEIAHAAGADIIWIQMPALGTQRYKHMRETQIAQHEFCEKNGVPSLCTDDVFSGEWGRFEPFGDFHGKYVRLRTKDTAHITREGNLKLIEHLMPIMEAHMARFYAAHPERRLSAEEADRIRRVPIVAVTSHVFPNVRKREREEEETVDRTP